jgi:hypothetical protein
VAPNRCAYSVSSLARVAASAALIGPGSVDDRLPDQLAQGLAQRLGLTVTGQPRRDPDADTDQRLVVAHQLPVLDRVLEGQRQLARRDPAVVEDHELGPEAVGAQLADATASRRQHDVIRPTPVPAQESFAGGDLVEPDAVKCEAARPRRARPRRTAPRSAAAALAQSPDQLGGLQPRVQQQQLATQRRQRAQRRGQRLGEWARWRRRARRPGDRRA